MSNGREHNLESQAADNLCQASVPPVDDPTALYEQPCQDDTVPLEPRVPSSGNCIESVRAVSVKAEAKETLQVPTTNSEMPHSIGRYRVERVLGKGGFGLVYLAYDEQLNRNVAIKVPHAHLISRSDEVESYQTEARTVANLDHPHIVPVLDVGGTSEFPFFVVSKHIDGSDLATMLKESRLSQRQTAELVVNVADALHHAHKQGLVHRDIKPGNILLDKSGKAFVVDFGLALREGNVSEKTRFAGTPSYTSPEQARGEGHRIDGRSDIFSLGVVLYELLTRRRPFRGDTDLDVIMKVVNDEPRPPRQSDETISRELERICLKALSKRASDRYTTAFDLAEDLRHFLGTVPQFVEQLPSPVVPLVGNQALQETAVPSNTPVATLPSDNSPIKIVPKGLRSFDAHDADFFLELLPGPRNRDGLPDSIRFWKTRIEEKNADSTFSVGLIYGPSGCGKSSLVKAGLLPWLAKSVTAIYIEATGSETETRLLKGLRRQLPNLPTSLNLLESLAGLRRGRFLETDQKLLLVLDQFEQWLHAQRLEENSELVQALRQCDGGRLQCIVMVRDDFWLAVSRFMQVLEVRILEAENSKLVDLFDPRHARRVLVAFGGAFGALPDHGITLAKDQDAFLDQAVADLSRDGKVISVRLALFAEMVKGKRWIPDTLKEVGGAAGVGVTFLEETFTSTTAPPQHRLHQKAAQAVLKALLPEAGSDIKGHMQSQQELLDAAGYGNRPNDFGNLIHILDAELRLITPTDPEGVAGDQGTPGKVPVTATQHAPPATRYYQLTHDYLVHSLRDWLTRKQKETRRGRAELKLAERSGQWNAKTENRHLATLWEWLGIRSLTDKKKWTVPQRAMMQRASQFHLTRLVTATMIVALITTAGLWTWHRMDQNRIAMLAETAKEQEAIRIEGMVGRLVNAEPAKVPEIVKELDSNPEVVAICLSPLLSANAKTVDQKLSQLHARLATVARDKSLIEPLLEELLTNKVVYIGPIREQLRPYKGELTGKLWAILRDQNADANRRFHAALAMADYVPDSEARSWTGQDLQFVARQLVSANAEFQPLLRENLRPIRGRLMGDLEQIFADTKLNEAQRLSAANAFADYAGSDIPKLSQLLTVATPEQYAVLYPIVAASPAPTTIEDLGKIAATLPPADLGSIERIGYGQRRANAAVTLLRLGEHEKVLPVFDMTDDPESLAQFIFRCRSLGIGVPALLDCLQLVSDAPQDRYPRNSRYALLLALGECSIQEIPASRREPLLKQLADWYRQDPNSGVHGAAGWLLRQWGQADIARQVDDTEVPYAPDREWFTLAIKVTPTAPPKPQEPSAKPDESGKPAPPPEETKPKPSPESPPPKIFYYTFIVFPAGDYEIGSVTDEPDRPKLEIRHPVKLTRPFALLDREITCEELIAFKPMYADFMRQSDAKQAAAGVGADWYDAVDFCRWLGQQSGLSEGDQSYADPEGLDKIKYPREQVPSSNWAPRNWPLELGRRGFRLPTESEWEVASCAGTRTAFGFGSEVRLLGRFGWFMENSGKYAHPLRELRPSIRGLFDMHGNLIEWTHDWLGDYGVDAVADPLGPEMGTSRVVRGGSWFNDAADCRSAYRATFGPMLRSTNLGFRLALSPSGVPPEAAGVKGAEPAGGGTEGTPAKQRPQMP